MNDKDKAKIFYTEVTKALQEAYLTEQIDLQGSQDEVAASIMNIISEYLPKGAEIKKIEFFDPNDLSMFQIVLQPDKDDYEVAEILKEVEEKHMLLPSEKKLISDVLKSHKFKSKEQFIAAVSEALPIRYKVVDALFNLLDADERTDYDFILPIVLANKASEQWPIYVLVERNELQEETS